MTAGSFKAAALATLLAAGPAPQPTDFDHSPAPPAPDYRLPTSWAAHAEGPRTRTADVFYIQPTTEHGEVWNQDIADRKANAWVDASVTRRQLSLFAACCRLYQPRYRAATARAFAAMKGDGGKAYALAYGDVLRAFRQFVSETGERPFIVAGHSQGALLGLRLLEEEVAPRPLRRRLVAAYLPGIGIPVGYLDRATPRLGPCATAAQTGCVLSWNSWLVTGDPAGFVAQSQTRYTQRFGEGPGKALLCLNPLTFDAARPEAPASANIGALLGTPGPGPLPPPTPHAAAAACVGEVLRVTPAPGVALEPLPGGNLHMYDIALFRANIAVDAIRRVGAFKREHSR